LCETMRRSTHFGGKNELVRSDFCAILVFDYKIIKLIFFAFLMIQFYVVIELVTSRNHSDSHLSPRVVWESGARFLLFSTERQKKKELGGG